MLINFQARYMGALCAAFFFCATQATFAKERIVDFHSDIVIAADGSMIVEESIRVIAEGGRIKRGIYRDFPTTYKDDFGNSYKVDFDVLGVTRDGQEEKWHTRRQANGTRIYAGDADVYLEPGTYTYRFRYYTDWQLGFFEGKDELYWNVTGNGWKFAIDSASARVVLPESVPAEQLQIEGYTGLQGSRDRNYTSDLSSGEGRIQSSVPLAPQEGLTLVLSWPKGIVKQPGQLQRFSHFVASNLGLLLGFFALSGSASYLLLMWHRHGRDPKEGVIFPHYEPPTGHSPASLRYVERMGYDNKTFTAAIINLAVKGYIDIECDKRFLGLKQEYTLTLKPSEKELSPGEKDIMAKLFAGGATLKLSNENHTVVSRARTAHKKALSKDYLDRYFRLNLTAMLPTAVGSIVVLVLIAVTGTFVPWVAGIFLIILALHILFVWLLKAPSQQGRKLMDESKGFQMYLDVAEKEELNLRNPPEMTPELFEAYLPFAIALGVEQNWAEKFSRVFDKLNATGTAGNHYHPVWYHGDFDHNNINTFSSAVGSGLDSAISSASKAPGSSSGGGGGFSGGGGGGGGGGGW